MADDSENDTQEPIDKEENSPYHKYPLRPTFWQRAKERFSNPDKNAELEALRKRRLRSLGQDE